MSEQGIQLPHNHQMVLDRFVTACRADERVLAAFLGGSCAKGTVDAYSDLDLFLITSDETYEDFLAGREGFVQLLGEPLFLEDFGTPDGLFYILADGTEGELWIGRKSRFDHIHVGPYRILLDEHGVLSDAVFPHRDADRTEQAEVLRRQIYWFWHELSHFITAMGRGQLWWAYGQLEAMRLICVTLARLEHNFLDPETGEEPYFKIEQAVPEAQFSALKTTYCPMDRDAIRQAARVVLSFYRELAPPLARKHGMIYPANLERVMFERLESLDDVGYRGAAPRRS